MAGDKQMQLCLPDTSESHAANVITAHLSISKQLERMWQRGDNIMDAVHRTARARSRAHSHGNGHSRRLLPCFSFILRVLRRLGKYEDLRSSLEDMLYEQVQDVEGFMVAGRDHEIRLTHVYFSRHRWRTSETNLEDLTLARVVGGCGPAEPCHNQHDDDDVDESDNALIICYFSQVQQTLEEIERQVRAWEATPSTSSVGQELRRALRMVLAVKNYMMRLLERQMLEEPLAATGSNLMTQLDTS